MKDTIVSWAESIASPEGRRVLLAVNKSRASHAIKHSSRFHVWLTAPASWRLQTAEDVKSSLYAHAAQVMQRAGTQEQESTPPRSLLHYIQLRSIETFIKGIVWIEEILYHAIRNHFLYRKIIFNVRRKLDIKEGKRIFYHFSLIDSRSSEQINIKSGRDLRCQYSLIRLVRIITQTFWPANNIISVNNTVHGPWWGGTTKTSIRPWVFEKKN